MVLLAFVQAIASKRCLPTGEWYRDEHNSTWTNYSLCFAEEPPTVAVNFSEFDSNPLISVSTVNYRLCFTEQTITVTVPFSVVDRNPLISVSTLNYRLCFTE